MDPIKAMLAQEVDAAKLDRYIKSDEWIFQQKLDGERLLVTIENGEVLTFNRKGEPKGKAINPNVLREFIGMPEGVWFDGELVGDVLANAVFWLFDLPLAPGAVALDDPLEFRLDVLDSFFAGWQPRPWVRLLPRAESPSDKAVLAKRLEAAGAEGVMLKHRTSPYQPFHRSRWCLKAKYVKEIDCIVSRIGVDGKESACLAVVTQKGKADPFEIGKCSLIGKPPVNVGDVVTVRYLYATDDNRLYQPRLIRVRDDKAALDCDVSQLVYTDRTVIV